MVNTTWYCDIKTNEDTPITTMDKATSSIEDLYATPMKKRKMKQNKTKEVIKTTKSKDYEEVGVNLSGYYDNHALMVFPPRHNDETDNSVDFESHIYEVLRVDKKNNKNLQIPENLPIKNLQQGEKGSLRIKQQRTSVRGGKTKERPSLSVLENVQITPPSSRKSSENQSFIKTQLSKFNEEKLISDLLDKRIGMNCSKNNGYESIWLDVSELNKENIAPKEQQSDIKSKSNEEDHLYEEIWNVKTQTTDPIYAELEIQPIHFHMVPHLNTTYTDVQCVG